MYTTYKKYSIASLHDAHPALVVARALNNLAEQLALVATGLPYLCSCAPLVVPDPRGGAGGGMREPPSHRSSTVQSRFTRSLVQDIGAPPVIPS
jgi:hypothetical protein